MSAKILTANKSIPGLLYVHMQRASGIRQVGELLIDDQAPGGFAAKFKYATDWLGDGFPIDMLNLPLQSGWFATSNRYVKLGVLFDAGPDMWGRRVMQHAGEVDTAAHLGVQEQKILIKGRGNGVGALIFSESPTLSASDLPCTEALPHIECDLESVHQAAHNVFSRTKLPDHLQGLLAGSWSIGGARAKAVMRDSAGDVWIAKFSEPGDKFDRQRCELANLQMAASIGLHVPECQVIDTQLGSVFLIKRFDRTIDAKKLHFSSAISLIIAVSEDKRLTSAFDRATFSYAKIADIISKVSPDPVQERKELFARMAFNVCVKNTDDHLKNIGFLESETDLETGSGRGLMRLAPVFDVVTQAQEQHYLHIGREGRIGSFANVLSDIRHFRLTARGASDILNHVAATVSRRHDFYEDVGLCGADIEWLDMQIESRCPAVEPLRSNFKSYKY